MEQEAIDLSETLLQIYIKNLRFLEQNFNDVFKRVEELSGNLNNQIITPKYSLEFRDNYFDILNIATNSWYYGSNSYDDGDSRITTTNFSKDGSLDLLRKDINGFLLMGGEELKDINPLIEYINRNVDLNNIEFDKIYKFIFIGIGLGIHIQGINRKLKPYTTLIIEPELEVFRLSLFVTDYTEFQNGSRKLFLSVEEDKLSRIATIEDFYSYHNYMNYNIKHHLLIESDRYLFDELVDFFHTNSVTSFPYTSIMENVFRTKSFMKSKHRFLDMDKIAEKKILADKKILLIAAGPSLDEYIDWIVANQDKFIVVCVDVILRKLEKHKIIPDVVFSIDPSFLCAGYLTCEDEHFLDSSAIIFLSQQHPDVMKIVEKKNIYFSQSIPFISKLGYLGSVSNVGTFSYMVAVHLGAKEIYTIGNDAAFDQKTGSRYAKGSSYKQNEEIEIEEKNDNLVSAFDVVEVKGNLQDIVKTNRSLLAFKDSFESITHALKQHYEFEVFNLSNGVLIEHFTPMTKNEIEGKIIHFADKNHKIVNDLDSISEVLQKEDIEFKGDKNKLLGIVQKVKKYQKLEIQDRQDFLEKKLEMMVWILEKSKDLKITVFGNLFLMYTEFSDIYINFILNLKQEELFDKKHLTKLNTIWANGILSVLYDFQKVVDNDK